jgi:ATP-dependent RNA/DNA helicase IGHMBP2
MNTMEMHLKNLLFCIDLEEKEQVKRYQLDEKHSLKKLKSEGLALHPIVITHKNFGYADYPELRFKLNFPAETQLFKSSIAIECFCANEAPVKGILLNIEGKVGEFRLFAPDFPEWIEDDGVGIKLAPDQHTTTVMKTAINKIEKNERLNFLFNEIYGYKKSEIPQTTVLVNQLNFTNQQLNTSQQTAIAACCGSNLFTIIHGPPGTGKTTTLVEAIVQLVKNGEKILVSAPSNTAVDNIAKALLVKNINLLRVGNSNKTDATIFLHTIEGKQNNSKQQKEIKQLKIRAEEFRKMALKYKRSFGKAEREQRNLLFAEVKSIQAEIKRIQFYNEEKLYTEANVIVGTPVGLYDAKINKYNFDTLVIDEAGQCIEPLAWCIFPLANKFILAGDHLQLPPTVLSNEAMQLGFNQSILEKCIPHVNNVFLLNIQYRMRESIAGFSSNYFYNSLLQTAKHLANNGTHIYFIDTAGSGFYETKGQNGMSLQNEGEIDIIKKLLEIEYFDPTKTVFISPYAGQVAAAKELLNQQIKVSTIDSFQGQEAENIILSLVRSNEDNDIGFLKDYRRMNVAITRAKEKLFVIGDSATIGSDNFFKSFIEYVEKFGVYKSVWEF